MAQHGNLRLSDEAESEILDSLRAAAADLLGAPLPSVAVVGGASEGLGQLAGLLSDPHGQAILVPSDFPSVTYPWLAARERSGMDICWVPDVATDDLTESIVDTISERTTAVDARRFELSTMSYSAASGLLASIELLDGIGLSSIREHSDRLAGTSSRVGGLRVSLHLYNSEDDVRALVEALESIGP